MLAYSQSLTQTREDVDVDPGQFFLPVTRRFVIPDGPQEAIPPHAMTAAQRGTEQVELAKWLAQVTEAVEDRRRALSAADLRDLNAAEMFAGLQQALRAKARAETWKQ